MADPLTFLGAIKARVDSDPTLAAALPGRAFEGLGDRATPRPFLSLTEVANPSSDWDTSGTRWVHAVVQGTIHAATSVATAAAYQALDDAFRPNMPVPLAIQRCDVRRVWLANEHLEPKDAQAPDSGLDFRRPVEFHAILVRFAPNLIP